jgi:putative acetyltransferase
MPTESLSNPLTGFSIRRATNADVAAIRSVLHAVRLEYGVLSATGADDPDLDDIEFGFFRRGGTFEVVEDRGGRILGCAGLYPLSQHRAELCKMYLEKPARGQGLGKRMLKDLLDAARRGGFREVWLETNRVLTEAITLYRQHGFEPVESEHLLPRCDQAFMLRLDGEDNSDAVPDAE